MKIFAYDVPRPKASPEEIKPYLKAEALATWECLKSEVLREIYFRKDRPGAVLVLEAPSVEEARKALANLPLVREGFISFEFLPVGPFLGFESLFEKSS